MLHNEAQARIRINRLLEEAGWRFFDSMREKQIYCLKIILKLLNSK